jgi:hypothetical protein
VTDEALLLLARWQANCINRRLQGQPTPMDLYDDTAAFLAEHGVTVEFKNDEGRILTTIGSADSQERGSDG